MRVTKQKVAEHRHAILETASRLFRERGFTEVGVAEIMQASGLTHGAFYGHFRSKADLANEACRSGCAQSLDKWQAAASLGPILDHYLSPAHRDNPSKGCTLAALGGEVARQTPMQPDYAAGVSGLVAVIERHLAEPDPAARRREASTALAAMVGALVLARGTAEGDPALSDDLLAGVREQLQRRFGL